MDKIVKQYDIPYGDKVVLVDTVTLQYTTMFYMGMDTTNKGTWKMSGYEFKGNLFGKFHWNTSQKYWYYRQEDN